MITANKSREVLVLIMASGRKKAKPEGCKHLFFCTFVFSIRLLIKSDKAKHSSFTRKI